MFFRLQKESERDRKGWQRAEKKKEKPRNTEKRRRIILHSGEEGIGEINP